MEKARRNKRKNNRKFYFAGVRLRPPGGPHDWDLREFDPLSPSGGILVLDSLIVHLETVFNHPH
jgi:hypothetical protein